MYKCFQYHTWLRIVINYAYYNYSENTTYYNFPLNSEIVLFAVCAINLIYN